MKKYFVSKPEVIDSKPGEVVSLMEHDCPYCKKRMDFVGVENAIRKRLIKEGHKDSVKRMGLKKGSSSYVFTCPDKVCGGMFIRDHLIIGNENTKFTEPGEYDKDQYGGAS